MAIVHEKRFLPFPPDFLFNLVSDVEKYPQFLPWCRNVRITKHLADSFIADMIVGFKSIRQGFTSRVFSGSKQEFVRVELVKGPFNHLDTLWKFQAETEDEVKGTLVDFKVDFAIKSRVLAVVLEPLFAEAQRRIVAAFEKRAYELHEAAA